jgi:hypothetical protein
MFCLCAGGVVGCVLPPAVVEEIMKEDRDLLRALAKSARLSPDAFKY